jgi:hypothetical protein
VKEVDYLLPYIFTSSHNSEKSAQLYMSRAQLRLILAFFALQLKMNWIKLPA